MFSITITENAKDDMRFLTKAQRNTVLDAIARHLSHEPLRTDRNRKPLDENDLGAWELRAGDLRVFYDVTERPDEVSIKAVGWKEHSKLFLRGKEYQL